MSIFKWGLLTGCGTHTEFQLYSLEPRNLPEVNYNVEGISTQTIDSIIGPENSNANFRHATYHCSYRYPGYKTNAIGFVICSWDKGEIEKLVPLFVNYLRDYLQKCEPNDWERFRLSLIGVNYEQKNKEVIVITPNKCSKCGSLLGSSTGVPPLTKYHGLWLCPECLDKYRKGLI